MIEIDWNTTKPHGEAVFKQALAEHLEEYSDLSVRTLDDVYNHLINNRHSDRLRFVRQFHHRITQTMQDFGLIEQRSLEETFDRTT